MKPEGFSKSSRIVQPTLDLILSKYLSIDGHMLGQIMIRSAPPNCQSCAAALAAAMTETNYD